VEQPGLQVLSVDNLPTEFPLEASNHFSECLLPFVKEMVRRQFADCPWFGTTAKENWDHPVLKRAIIAEGGNLAQSYTHLKRAIEKSVGSSPVEMVTCTTRGRESKRVLLLGSGMVAGPLVDYLLRIEDVHVVIASNDRSEATSLAKDRDRTEVVNLDVANAAMVSQLVSRADVVVSLVPAPLHPTVAQSCIKERKHMVTASYISPAMRSLDEDAKQAGVAIMNEIGLDPGIDHLTAMRTIDEVKHEGGKIRSFISWCGGLPAPEFSDLPLAYKFSWSPRGVLTAGKNASRFKMAGKLEEVPGHRLLPSRFPTVPLGFSGFAFEGLANRDALQYTDTYALPPVGEMETMFRGTLRYKGFADMMYRFSRLGFLGTENMDGYEFRGWPDFLDKLLAPGSVHLTDGDRRRLIAEKAGFPDDGDPNAAGKFRDALRFFGLLPGCAAGGAGGALAAPPANTPKTPLDMFCALLSRRLRYLPGERDMVVLQHEFGVETRSGRRETRTSTFVAYGGPQYTAMAKTVGYPAAIAAELLLRGQIHERGVLAPVSPHVYNPIIERLEKEGIRVTECTREGGGMVQGGLRCRDAGWP
ncbi:MAG: Saccharopine dehydrogenase-domain-containing protein, partial [Olpidium bornovanus]